MLELLNLYGYEDEDIVMYLEFHNQSKGCWVDELKEEE